MHEFLLVLKREMSVSHAWIVFGSGKRNVSQLCMNFCWFWKEKCESVMHDAWFFFVFVPAWEKIERKEGLLVISYIIYLFTDDWFIDWCLAPSLVVFQLYRDVNNLFFNLKIFIVKTSESVPVGKCFDAKASQHLRIKQPNVK